MKRKGFILILLVVLLLPISSVTAFADSGPKPSVTIEFNGLEHKTCYVTLLSIDSSSGPWGPDNAWGEYPAGQGSLKDIFRSYKDKDGFYFLDYVKDCSNNNSFEWTYWPPDEFKLLIYLPETKEFIISKTSYKRYAFHATYTATIKDNSMILEETPATVKEGISFFARVLVTLAIELGIALLFSYSGKRQLLIITLTNIVTQVFLNIILFFVIGPDTNRVIFYFYYLLLEILIFVIEGIAYQLLLPRYALYAENKSKPWAYSFTANLTSFILGILLAQWLPFIY